MNNRINRHFETPTPVGGEDDFRAALRQSPEFLPDPPSRLYTAKQVSQFGAEQWADGFDLGRKWEREVVGKIPTPCDIIIRAALAIVLFMLGLAAVNWVVGEFWY